MVKKAFFREPTEAQIRRRKPVNSSGNHLTELINLNPDQYLVISTPLLKPAFQDEPEKFEKHGPEIPVHRFPSMKQACQQRTTPLDLREQAYKQASKRTSHSCYSFSPLIGNERRRRRVSLVQILDGAQLFAHATRDTEGIKVTPYHDAGKVARDGAQVIVTVPSTEKKKPRYKAKVSGVPVKDNERKHAIAFSFKTDHVCDFKRFKGLRYPYETDPETSEIEQVCKHDVASEYGIIDHYWNQEHNIRPLETTPIALPSQLLVDLYKRMLDSLLVYDPKITAKNNLRKPNQAEKQVLLDQAVKTLGHNETLFCDGKRDGHLSTYDWSLRQE
tara:strand:+ start:439 stop:1431 length:993 start_codon:yes stop_codon:yes gene_type:complete